MIIGNLEFDDEFIKENMMGPNSVRIVEEISKRSKPKERFGNRLYYTLVFGK